MSRKEDLRVRKGCLLENRLLSLDRRRRVVCMVRMMRMMGIMGRNGEGFKEEDRIGPAFESALANKGRI